MGMKPRLPQTHLPLDGLVNAAKDTSETAAMPENLVNHTKVEPPKQLKGTEKPC